MATSEHAPWPKVGDAAEQYGLPQRTIYNAISSGKLKSRTEGGVKRVDPDGLAALLARRVAAITPAAAGTPPAVAPVAAAGGKLGVQTSGSVASKAFRALQEGVNPVDLVAELAMPPGEVAALVEHYEKLSHIGSKPGSKAAERLATIEQRLELLAQDLAMATNDFTLAQEVAAMREEIRRLNAVQEQIIAWTRSVLAPVVNLKCNCGSVGRTRIVTRCKDCGVEWLCSPFPQRR